MKILILNPGSKFTKNIIRDVLWGGWCKGNMIGGATVPPTPMLLMATMLDKLPGIEVEFIDAIAETLELEKFKEKIKHFDIVVMSSNQVTFQEDADLVRSFKKINPGLKAMIYGPEATFFAENALSDDTIDFIFIKEPEEALIELVAALRDGKAVDKINGIGYRQNGKIVFTEVRGHAENMDEWPFIDLKFMPKDANYFNPLVRRYPYMTMETARGCPYRCTFCTSPAFYGRKFRAKSPDVVVAEMEYYVKNGIKEIFFRDDTFTFNKQRTIEICEKIIEKKLDVTWICNARTDRIDEEMMDIMKKAGCHTIKFGVESGNQKLLDNVKKDITLEETERVFKYANKLNFWTHAHMMLGLPGETKDTIKRTFRFISKIKPTTVTYSVFVPYKGTAIYNDIMNSESSALLNKDLNMSTLYGQATVNELFTEVKNKDLEKYVRLGYIKFYVNPNNLLRILTRSGNLGHIFRNIKAGYNVVKYMVNGE